MPLHRPTPAACLLAMCALAMPALATSGRDAPGLGAQDAALLAAACANCHGPAGHPPAGIAALHGQPAERLLQRMTAFQTTPLDAADAAATVMPRLMRGYDAAQIQALAQWFAAQPAQP